MMGILNFNRQHKCIHTYRCTYTLNILDEQTKHKTNELGSVQLYRYICTQYTKANCQ